MTERLQKVLFVSMRVTAWLHHSSRDTGIMAIFGTCVCYVGAPQRKSALWSGCGSPVPAEQIPRTWPHLQHTAGGIDFRCPCRMCNRFSCFANTLLEKEAKR